MQFKDIVGHQDVKSLLVSSVNNNRISHAQLFFGPEGNGALSLALAYAQFISCEDKLENDSCGVCASCRKISKIIHPDLHFSFPFFANRKEDVCSSFMEEWRTAFSENPYLNLDTWRSYLNAANKQANINIAEAHDIIKKLSLKSFESEYKILIMWLPEFLDQQANALLKLIEEPPEKTVFLLVAENTEKILSTVLSRTQLIKVNKYSHREIADYLVKEHKIDEGKATEVSFIADGDMHAALSLLHEKESQFFNLLISWLRHIVQDSGSDFIKQCEEDFPKLGRENQKSFLLYAIHILRQTVLIQNSLQNLVFLPAAELDFAEKLAKNYSLKQLEHFVELLEQTHYNVERNANPKVLFLDLSLQLVLIFKYHTFPKGTQYI